MLDPAKLKTGLKFWMDNQKPITAEGIALFCDAYEDYCLDAVASSGGALLVYDRATMEATLNGIPPVGTPASGALLFATAISQFWIGAIMTPSTVSATFVPATLQAALLPSFLNLDPTRISDDYAQDMADAIDTATKTVQTINNTVAPPVVGTVL